MREIKFRAWDKDTEQMIYSDERDKKDREIDYSFEVTKDGTTCWWEQDFDDSMGYPTTNSGHLDNIMQYTGLKDKNGGEIYEGDIVIFNHMKVEYPKEDIFLHDVNRTEYHKKYVTEFCNTYYRCGVRFRNGSTHFMVVQATIMNHNVEVIGNIYENPELEGRE